MHLQGGIAEVLASPLAKVKVKGTNHYTDKKYLERKFKTSIAKF
jgi:cell division septal protein FtsQ